MFIMNRDEYIIIKEFEALLNKYNLTKSDAIKIIKKKLIEDANSINLVGLKVKYPSIHSIKMEVFRLNDPYIGLCPESIDVLTELDNFINHIILSGELESSTSEQICIGKIKDKVIELDDCMLCQEASDYLKSIKDFIENI